MTSHASRTDCRTVDSHQHVAHPGPPFISAPVGQADVLGGKRPPPSRNIHPSCRCMRCSVLPEPERSLGCGGDGAKWRDYGPSDRKVTLEEVIGGVTKMQASP